jgi:hypothetical protein
VKTYYGKSPLRLFTKRLGRLAICRLIEISMVGRNLLLATGPILGFRSVGTGGMGSQARTVRNRAHVVAQASKQFSLITRFSRFGALGQAQGSAMPRIVELAFITGRTSISPFAQICRLH